MSIYQINKGVNRPIVFQGLKAQYIWWLGIGIASLLLMFALLYIAGVPVLACIGLVIGSGVLLFRWVYRSSRRYGEHGFMKKMAQRHIPRMIKCDKRF